MHDPDHDLITILSLSNFDLMRSAFCVDTWNVDVLNEKVELERLRMKNYNSNMHIKCFTFKLLDAESNFFKRQTCI